MEAALSPEARTAPGRRAYLRAAVIGCVLLVQLVSAIPSSPFRLDKLARPEGERVLRWAEGALRRVSIHAEREQLAEALVATSERVIAVRDAALQPLEPLFYITDTRQQWGLFISPARECFRLYVEARTGERNWRLLYRAPGYDGAELAGQLRYRRVRGLYNPNPKQGIRAGYSGFALLVANQVFARHPGYAAVRVRMERLRIGAPGEARASLGFEYGIERLRGAQP